MSKAKKIQEIAESLAEDVAESLQDSIGWAISGTSVDELSGDDFYHACEHIFNETIAILFRQSLRRSSR